MRRGLAGRGRAARRPTGLLAPTARGRAQPVGPARAPKADPAQGQGQVGDPGLPVGRHVAHRHLGPEAGRRLRLHGRFLRRSSTPTWPGIQLGELFPKLAKQADKFSLIRSMTHRNNGHETAAYLMQTGPHPGRAAGLSQRRSGVRAVQEPRIQRAHPALRGADPAAGPVLGRRLPGAEVQAVRHRRRPERTPVRGGRRGRPRHHRRAAEGPPRRCSAA